MSDISDTQIRKIFEFQKYSRSGHRGLVYGLFVQFCSGFFSIVSKTRWLCQFFGRHSETGPDLGRSFNSCERAIWKMDAKLSRIQMFQISDPQLIVFMFYEINWRNRRCSKIYINYLRNVIRKTGKAIKHLFNGVVGVFFL